MLYSSIVGLVLGTCYPFCKVPLRFEPAGVATEPRIFALLRRYLKQLAALGALPAIPASLHGVSEIAPRKPIRLSGTTRMRSLDARCVRSQSNCGRAECSLSLEVIRRRTISIKGPIRSPFLNFADGTTSDAGNCSPEIAGHVLKVQHVVEFLFARAGPPLRVLRWA